MIEHPAFPVEEWSVRETELHLDSLAQTESIFALSNGHIGLRGNLDEGEPHGLPGTYLNSFYELRPLPYAEGGYAYPESGQTAINVINGKLIRLLVDDEPFDVRYGAVRDHESDLVAAGTGIHVEFPVLDEVPRAIAPSDHDPRDTRRIRPGQRRGRVGIGDVDVKPPAGPAERSPRAKSVSWVTRWRREPSAGPRPVLPPRGRSHLRLHRAR